MKKDVKCLLSALVFAGISWGGYGIASAAGEAVYELNPVVVTATRTEKIDVDVPATTTVITAKDIQDKGYVSVFDALEHTVGVDSYNYSAGGGDDLGGSQSRFYIRGMDKGTLVLVNGAPINVMNYSSTEGVPVDAVEKIEVIKGSNSVLYGAEAMGGVVNIITKHGGKPSASISAKYGNYNSGYQVGVIGERYTAYFTRDFEDEFDDAAKIFPQSKYNWTNGKGRKSSLYLSTQLNDRLTLDWSHVDKNKKRSAFKVIDGKKTDTYYSYGIYDYDTQRNNINLIYNDKDREFKSVLAYNSRRIDTKQYKSGRAPAVRGTNYGVYGITFDNQKTWHFNNGKDNLTSGATFKREHYKALATPSDRIHRDAYSIYSSYDHQFSDKLSTIIGARGEFVKGNGWDKEQNVFLPQWQMLYKLNDSWSLYSNIGKSFDMPSINSKFYSKKTKAIDYQPQKGWSYEIGSKYVKDKDSVKIALFHMNIDNYFKWVKENQIIDGGASDINVQINGGEFKNTGLEAEWTHKINENWQYNLGVSWSDPKLKSKWVVGHENEWMQEAAKLQTNAGVQYSDKKWTANLNLFFTGEREYSYYTNKGAIAKNDGSYDHAIPNRVNLTSSISYAPNDSHRITLNMYNLLDRHNNCINENENYDLPFNWTLTYKYSF